MQARLIHLLEKRPQLETELQNTKLQIEQLQSLLSNPIMNCLKELLHDENMSALICDFLPTVYCAVHKTFVPREMVCLGCVQVELTSKILYYFKRRLINKKKRKTVGRNDVFEGEQRKASFHKDDCDLEQHLFDLYGTNIPIYAPEVSLFGSNMCLVLNGNCLQKPGKCTGKLFLVVPCDRVKEYGYVFTQDKLLLIRQV